MSLVKKALVALSGKMIIGNIPEEIGDSSKDQPEIFRVEKPILIMMMPGREGPSIQLSPFINLKQDFIVKNFDFIVELKDHDDLSKEYDRAKAEIYGGISLVTSMPPKH